MKIHIVQKGDTLWKIAKKYGVDFEELKMLNSQLSNTDMIMPGMKIKVPTTGGNIKKEAPKVEYKKEMPKTTQPIAKEMPIQKEVPKKEVPIQKELPKKEMPKKEKPFTPKMPTPIIPEIDVHNYYSMNMTNIDVDVEVEETKITPPKPVVIPPVEKPVAAPVQQEPCPPAIPYQPYCYEVSPMMPGSGFPPGYCPPPVQFEQMPETYSNVAPVNQTVHWEESSSSSIDHHYGGNPYVGMTQQPTPDYYQQPLVQYGQMPVGLNYMQGNQDESSSLEVMGMSHTPNVAQPAPFQLPFKEDCGCNGPSIHQQPMYQAPETFQVEGTMYPGMEAYPMTGGYNPGMPMGMMQPGMNPEMGGNPMAGGYNPGMPMGMMQPGMNPEMGG
ncbi:MAG TPA: SafA/ExsA family spore coat assembly protein, partial [Niallia sp.]|nr:SafA/ExsA family spore coat assembly protein [Niallia sp.]